MHPILQAADPSSSTAPSVWLERLLEAASPSAATAVIVELVESAIECEQATVLWWCPRTGTQEICPPRRVASADLTLVSAARHSDAPQWNQLTDTVAWRLSRSGAAVLLLKLTPRVDPLPLRTRLMPMLQLAGRQLQRTRELANLKHSHDQLERSGTLQRALFAIADLAGADLDMAHMPRAIHDIIRTLMYAENFFIVRHDAARDLLSFLYYADLVDTNSPSPGVEMAADYWHGTLTWYMLTTGKPLMGRPQKLIGQIGDGMRPVGPDSCHWLGVPMQRDGVSYGALVVQSYLEGISYTQEDCDVLAFVASHVLTALERRQSKNELELRVARRTQELAQANSVLEQQVSERQWAERLQAALFHIAQLATAALDEQAFFMHIHAIVEELVGTKNLAVALYDEATGLISFPYARDTRSDEHQPRPLRRGISEYVMDHGPLLATDKDLRQLIDAGHIDASTVPEMPLSMICVPLRASDATLGVVGLISYSAQTRYGTGELELLGFVATQIAASLERRRAADALHLAYNQLEQRVHDRTHALRAEITERERMQQQLRHQVRHDALTGLPNRDHLRERIDACLATLQTRRRQRCALLYIDIDRFKVINDSLGHLAGDAVLKEVATRLSGCVRGPDLVARLAGDEFVILLHSASAGDAIAVAERVLEAVALSMPVAGRELQPSASIGVALSDPRHATADALLRDADVALYRAKALGRKRYQLFDESLAKSAIDELTLEAELRQAMQRGEFEPYLQPICQIDTGERVGYEALIRWHHPQRGVLAPGAFLKVAQDAGHIEAIDWSLFEAACHRVARLADTRSFLTLNVSALHLRHADFDQRLLAMLSRTALAPARVIIEVTEGSLLDDPEQVRATLERLRVVGVGAALDDFGTGYSSLSYLHSLPLRLLKIDRAFVQALDDVDHERGNSSPIVTAILALARALDIRVIAEGIETPSQRQALAALGCELAQGYLLDRPAPIEHWLACEARASPAAAAPA